MKHELFPPDADADDLKWLLEALKKGALSRRDFEEDDGVRDAWSNLASAAGEVQRQLGRSGDSG